VRRTRRLGGASVAMAHGIDANVVHRWRQLLREGPQATAAKPNEFVPVAIAAPTPLPVQSWRDIEVELHRRAVAMARRGRADRAPSRWASVRAGTAARL
jgi:transposase-like protein